MSQSTILKAAEQYAEERLRDLFEKLEIDEDERKRFLEANTELRKRNVNVRRNRRAKRDPNAPKKPLNAYMHFARDESVREGIKKENEGITQKDLTIRLGKMWKEMSDSKKSKYTKLAEKDTERYAKENEEYKASTGAAPTPAPEAEASKKSKKAEKTEKTEKTDKKAEKTDKKESSGKGKKNKAK